MQMLKWWVGALAILALACGEISETATPVVLDGEGLLELPLVSTSAGRSYKLLGATFAITGPQNATITDTSADSVSLPLMAGTYSIQLSGDWHVERTDAPGVTVPVTLVSPNPMTFTLGEGETRPVRFLFKVPEGGTADVGIGVDSGGWIAGTIQFESGSPPPPPPFSELAGKSFPFVISFESATVTRSIESGIKRVTVQTSPVTLQFGGATGAAFQNQVVAALQGRTTSFFLEPPTSYSATPAHIALENPEQGIQFFLSVSQFDRGVDVEGYPLLDPMPNGVGFANFYTRPRIGITGVLQNGTFAPR